MKSSSSDKKKTAEKKDTIDSASKPEGIKSQNLFPVVGIGASAGGLDAFKKLLKAITEDSGMAYVLVQHLDPNHESLLPEILQKVTPIPVLEITDDMKVQPDHIYVIPSNKMMVATDGVLLLAPRPAKNTTGRNLPIDLFFTSLAEVHQEHAIGVVLSGTASDGTQGLKAIKEHGGITFAQDEASAEYDGMPSSAAQAGVVDFILPPEEIPKKLLEVTSRIRLSDKELENIPQQDEDVFKQILSLLRIRKGVDFTYYKQTTIRRRILRRMVVNKNEEPAEYLKFLRGNNPEQDLLYQDLLIPVTSFFRDKKVFENLCTNIFPTILKNKIPGEITRVWVAGCSTGQEVYSFAICFKEFLGDNHERLQIFGTDLSEPAITKARTGIYEKNELDSVSPERLKDYFTKNNGGYQVNKSIRDMCVFAQHNFLKDPPFGKMDVISCRNVLIYMEPYLQKKALTTFHYALNPNGFLLLGKSETTGGVPDLFAAVGKSDKLYTRKDVPGRFIQVTSQRSEQILSRANDHSKIETVRTDFQKTADDILLTKYTPAGVVVNEAMDIVHFRGNTGNYLEQSPGKPSHNLLLMAKSGLGFELRNILHKAKTDKAPVVKENIPLSVHGNLRHISIEAMPLPNTLEPYYLVLIHDNNLNDVEASTISSKKKVSAKTKKDKKDIQIQLLEHELAQAREDMRSITEEQEASNEELQSANEELLSGSEELQSLNEELETSKEELQSTNEELTVLNHELVSLNEQVTDARNYSESIVATLYQPLLVLDKHLRVKTANKAFYKTFQVDEQETEGVLIYDLGNRQWNIPQLRTLLEEILPQKKQITDFEVNHNFLSIGERVILLSALEITREKKEEKLILLSIEDITERKQAQKKIEASEKHLQDILYQAPAAICVLDGPEHKYALANSAYQKMISRSEEKLLGKTVKEVFPELQASGAFEIFDSVFKTGERFTAPEFPVLIDKLNDGINHTIYFNWTLEPIKKDGKVISLMVVAYDITEQIEARKKIEESENRFANMIYNSPSLISIFKGEDMIIEIANDAILKSWGKGKDIIGKSLFEVMPEIVEQGFRKILSGVYKTGEPYHAYETPVTIIRNGKQNIVYYTFTYQPQRNVNGEIEGVAVLSSEVTPEAEFNKKVKESETKFRTLIEDAPVATCLFTGREMRIEVANDKMLAYWGKGKNVIGQPLADALPELKGQPFLQILDEVFTTGKIYEAKNELAQLEVNGVLGTYYFDYTYKPIRNAAGEVYGIMDMAVDVTEQVFSRKKIEESESHFRTMSDLMPQKVWTADMEGNYNYFNQCWLDYSGLDFEELKDWGWKKVIHPEDWEETKSRWQHSITTGENFEMEHRFRNTEGIYKWHLSRGLLQTDEYGISKLWIGTNTEMHHLKEEEERKGDFLKMVSHELKTPVTSIKGYVQLLLIMLKEQEATPSSFLETPLLRIDSQLKRLSRLISEMLDLSRLETGKLELQKGLFSLNDLVIETVQDIKFTNTDHAINISPDFSGSVYGDKDRIEQVIINIINNAIKYSPGNNLVEVSIHRAGNNQIAVSIKDYGIGVDAEHQQKIFDRFYRAGGKSEENYAGFGIGLFIAKEIIERHDGTLTIESEKGKGSIFTFILPLATEKYIK